MKHHRVKAEKHLRLILRALLFHYVTLADANNDEQELNIVNQGRLTYRWNLVDWNRIGHLNEVHHRMM